MITDVRAQIDLIAALHLGALASNQSDRAIRSVTSIPHSMEQESLHLRHRLAVIQTLAVRARGLTIKTDMAQDESTRRNGTVSSQLPANAAAEEETSTGRMCRSGDQRGRV